MGPSSFNGPIFVAPAQTVVGLPSALLCIEYRGANDVNAASGVATLGDGVEGGGVERGVSQVLLQHVQPGTGGDRMGAMCVAQPMGTGCGQPLCALRVGSREHLGTVAKKRLEHLVQPARCDALFRIGLQDGFRRPWRACRDIDRFAEQVRAAVHRMPRVRLKSARHQVVRQCAAHLQRHRHQPGLLPSAGDCQLPAFGRSLTIGRIRRTRPPVQIVDARGHRFGRAQAGRIQQLQRNVQPPMGRRIRQSR
jgi:hypothetical protein